MNLTTDEEEDKACANIFVSQENETHDAEGATDDEGAGDGTPLKIEKLNKNTVVPVEAGIMLVLVYNIMPQLCKDKIKHKVISCFRRHITAGIIVIMKGKHCLQKLQIVGNLKTAFSKDC